MSLGSPPTWYPKLEFGINAWYVLVAFSGIAEQGTSTETAPHGGCLSQAADLGLHC